MRRAATAGAQRLNAGVRRQYVGVEFVIRSMVINQRRGALVFAGAVAAETYFRVPPGSTLGGVPVQPYVVMPFRDLPDGTPDLPVFLFELVQLSDERRIPPGTAVKLEPGSYCSKHDFMEAQIRLSRIMEQENKKWELDSRMRALKGPPLSDAEIDEIVRREIREARPQKPWWRFW